MIDPALFEFVWKVSGFLVVAGSVYGGIRSDLRRLNEKSRESILLAIRAHDKIDGHVGDHVKSGHCI